MKKSKIAKVISIVFVLLLIVGTLCLIFIPFLYDYFKGASIESFSSHKLIYKIAFYTCYLIGLFILYKLTTLFNNVYKESPFNKNVETSLKIIAIMFMSLFLIVIIKSIFIPTLLTFIVAIICFVASLSFYCLAEVIKSAIAYKNELDLTV